MTEIIDTKEVRESQQMTIQSQVREPAEPTWGTGLLYWLGATGVGISPWWSPSRDIDLRAFVKKSDHLSSAMSTLIARLTSVNVRVEPRDIALRRHIKLADRYNELLVEGSQFGLGWSTCFGKWLTDFFETDNGAFWEIIGPGPIDGPLTGPPVSIAVLDSSRCIRTSNVQYPVLYQDRDGKYYKLHYSRVAFASSLPSNIVEMNNVGFCAISRAVHNAQNLIDIGRYKEEKLGSRPQRAILFAKGVSVDAMQYAMQAVALQMDDQGLSRYAKIPMVGGADIPPDADISLVDLASLPDGFDEEMSTRLGMFTIAMAFGVPIRWLWPAAVIGATKADALYQHISGLNSAGQILNLVSVMLGGDPRGPTHSLGKFLPPSLRLVFDLQDDEQDRINAEIEHTRADTRIRNLESGVTNVRVERERALADNDLTRAQFIQLELDDGRLEDGTPIIALFGSDNRRLSEFLDIGIDNPLAVSQNDSQFVLQTIDEKLNLAYQAALQGGTAKENATVAIAALMALKEMYEPLEEKPTETQPSSDDMSEELEEENG